MTRFPPHKEPVTGMYQVGAKGGSFRSHFNHYRLEVYLAADGTQRIDKYLPATATKQLARETWARDVLASCGIGLAPGLSVREEPGHIVLTMPYIARGVSSIRDAGEKVQGDLGVQLAQVHALSKSRASEADIRAWEEKIARTLQHSISESSEAAELDPRMQTLIRKSVLFAPLSLIHRDLRDDNILVDGESMIYIIDWEHSTIGHPDQDLVRLRDSLNPASWNVFSAAYRSEFERIAGHWSDERWSTEMLAFHRLVHCSELLAYVRSSDTQQDASFADQLRGEIESLVIRVGL